MIERVYGESAKKTVRYAIKKEGSGVFDEERLRGFAGAPGAEYRLELIGAETYAEATAQKCGGRAGGYVGDLQSIGQR